MAGGVNYKKKIVKLPVQNANSNVHIAKFQAPKVALKVISERRKNT